MKFLALKVCVVLSMLFVPASYAQASNYDETVAKWTSYNDVGNWLEDNFKFSKNRQKTIRSRLKSQGPSGLLIRDPSKLFSNKTGYCADSANFALHSLNKISAVYNPRWVFINNTVKGKANHWVTGFTVDGKLYVMDYGAGHNWDKMNGTHGPYETLDDYRNFLASLNIKGFKVGDVYWREMPGTVD